MEEKLELNLSFTKYTSPNNYHSNSQLPTSTTTSQFSPPILSPSSVFYPYINTLMPSTPSSSSFSPPPPSSPSAGGHDAPFNNNTTIVHVNNMLPPLPAACAAAASSSSSACAACKYQRRKCGPECMLSPYFPPERQQDFQNAHRLFGVSNIVKKLREIAPSQRRSAVESMVYEAYMHAINPPGGCHSQVKYLETQLEFLLRQLNEVRRHLASYKGAQAVGFENEHPQEQQFADHQSRSSFVSSLDTITPCQQQNQNSEDQHLQDYFYFNGNLIDERDNNNNSNGNSNNTDIGSHVDIACNYLNNDYNTHQVDQEAVDRDEIIRPFMDILPNCSDSEEGGEEQKQLVCKSGSATVDMDSLNSALVNKSTKCSLGLGFSAF